MFEQLKARLVQEAWVTGGLEHPGIVPVYEIGQTPTGIPYYTMRYVRGERTLADAIREKRGETFEQRLDLLEAFLKVCDTLRYAHDKGVVHRDLKPANVALGNYGEVVLLDWGLARLGGNEDVASSAWQQQVEVMRHDAGFHTMEGGVIGTAGYMAPEAALGRLAEVDERSDVFSLGVMLFEILTGRLPFHFHSYAEYASQLQQETPPAATEVESSVPRALSELCARALSRAKSRRPNSADAVARAVRAGQTERAMDQEARALVERLSTALGSAHRLSGDHLVEPLDIAGAALQRLKEIGRVDSAVDDLETRLLEERARRAREIEHHARRRTARRLVSWATFLLALGAVIAAVLVGRERNAATEAAAEAQRQQGIAECASMRAQAQLLAKEAGAALVDSPQRGTLLAAEAARATRERYGFVTPAAYEQLHMALASYGGLNLLPGQGDVTAIALASDGDTAALGLYSGRVVILRMKDVLAGFEPTFVGALPFPVRALRFGPPRSPLGRGCQGHGRAVAQTQDAAWSACWHPNKPVRGLGLYADGGGALLAEQEGELVVVRALRRGEPHVCDS